MANRTADDTTQHITTAFVTWNHAIHNQECTSTNMIGNDFQRGRINRRFTTGHMNRLLSRCDQTLEEVDFVIAVYMLQYGGNTLKTHTGIHAGTWERMQDTRFIAVELHEHQIPDLDVTITVFFC